MISPLLPVASDWDGPAKWQSAATEAQRVLFTVGVTKPLLRQLVLGLVLSCHSSFRGVVEFLKELCKLLRNQGKVLLAFILGDTFDGAVKSARAKHPTRLSHTIRIGHRAAFHLGSLQR